jgi:aldehyde dehydrogenase (NAD+)
MVIEAGFPPGVINFISGGRNTGHLLASHMGIDKISFTGSATAGRKVQEAAAKSNLKRVTLELGGKSPCLIFDDADFETALTQASQGFLINSGQVCAASSRTYVQEGIAQKFSEALKARFEGFVGAMGDPSSENTFLGPLADRAQFERVMNFLELGKQDSKVLTGGGRHGDKGNFIEPTIFVEPDTSSKIYTDEVFGPVLVLKTFKTEDEVIAMANNTHYGLAAYLHTADITRALRVSAALQAGSVYINCDFGITPNTPFGGWKESGNGARESGRAGLMAYLQEKSVLIG